MPLFAPSGSGDRRLLPSSTRLTMALTKIVYTTAAIRQSDSATGLCAAMTPSRASHGQCRSNQVGAKSHPLAALVYMQDEVRAPRSGNRSISRIQTKSTWQATNLNTPPM
jgi:hypothetical protein